jgi:dipeptidyl aminopeptidase/acylaminoacyl peptidase
VVARAPGGLIVKDVSRDGLVLLAQTKFAQSTVCLPPGDTREVDFSWHDFSELMDFSDDGKTMLLVDVGHSTGATGAIYLRKTDGSPAVPLGEGVEAALSPDAKSVVTIPSSRDRLVLLPTGPGEPKVLRAQEMSYAAVKWFPDGKRILLSASASARPVRLYVQEVAGGAPRPLTPEGFEGGPISPDGKLVVVHDPSGKLVFYPVDGGEPHALTGIAPDEDVIRFDATGEALFLSRGEMPMRIERLTLSTGRREFWKEIAPADRSGVAGVTVKLTPDGKSYAYWYLRELSDLFVVEGLR